MIPFWAISKINLQIWFGKCSKVFSYDDTDKFFKIWQEHQPAVDDEIEFEFIDDFSSHDLVDFSLQM